MNTKLLFALPFGLALGLALPAHAQSAMKLTPQDYADIEQLVQKYADALDNCTDNGDSYANLYVADGEFGTTKDPNVAPAKLTKGHDALARVGGGSGPGGQCKDPTLSRNYGATHFTVGLIITPAAGGAIGKGIPLLLKPDGTIVRQGVKRDFFVKTADGWRFKSEWHIETPTPAPAAAPAAAASK